MNLNNLSPDIGSKRPKKRVGRGIGSGVGKTAGKGHKGQKARAGGFTKINFEGGQMPIQRRLPKLGFQSRKKRFRDEVNLTEIELLKDDLIDLTLLKKKGYINKSILEVKIIFSGEIKSAVKIKGLKVTKGARDAIEKAGGSIED